MFYMDFERICEQATPGADSVYRALQMAFAEQLEKDNDLALSACERDELKRRGIRHDTRIAIFGIDSLGVCDLSTAVLKNLSLQQGEELSAKAVDDVAHGIRAAQDNDWSAGKMASQIRANLKSSLMVQKLFPPVEQKV